MFCWNASPEVADYYERALYNHILGQQDPETGMVAYFLPLLSGAHKVYSTPDNSFWCCVGSGFESHAKYAESIYFHHQDKLFVNLFIPSVLNWRELRFVRKPDFRRKKRPDCILEQSSLRVRRFVCVILHGVER